ncbi:MAG: hypothetical protein LBJ59_03450 [Zoogloeaceae bacterium]|jgi:hypothetical protein|nr:hypothetical protein [Zoogloeaceae bacterium]
MGFFDWFSGRQTADSPETAAAIDCLIKTIDPRLAAISSASAQLAPVVESALAFCWRVADEIPGPLDASLAHWRDSPLLCALFTRNEDLQQAFSRQEMVHDALAEQPFATRFYALLGAVFEERKSFGVVLENGALRPDVAVTSLNFTRHRLFLPCVALETFTRDVAWALFRHLALEILYHLSQMKEEAAERREEIAFLRAQLAYHGQQGLGEILAISTPEEDAAEEGVAPETPESLARQLAESQAALKAAGEPLQNLENTLEWIIQRLADPARLLNMQTLRYRINNVNQVVTDDQPGVDLCFCHFSVHAPTPRQGILLRVTYPVDELLPRRQIAAQMAQLL